jgi:hypothetical protein
MRHVNLCDWIEPKYAGILFQLRDLQGARDLVPQNSVHSVKRDGRNGDPLGSTGPGNWTLVRPCIWRPLWGVRTVDMETPNRVPLLETNHSNIDY